MESLLYTGLSNALVAGVLALLAAGIGCVSRRPALVHSLWLLVLVKLITPPLLPLPVIRLSLSEPRPAEGDVVVPTEGSAAPDPGDVREPGPNPVRDQIAGDLPAAPPMETAPEPLLPPASPRPVAALPPGLSWETAVAAVWLTGSVLWLSLAAVRCYRFGRFLRGAVPAPAGLQEQVRRLSRRLGLDRCPGVWFVPGRVSPMLWAVGGPPRLLLPTGLWHRLTADQQETLLAHELAHLRRRDHWVRRLELVVTGLYWWHPVVWWAQRELHEAEEQCCDAWVVAALPEAAEAYASALVESVAYLSQARTPLPLGASGVGQVHRLKRRLLMILSGKTPKTLSRAGLWAVLGLGVVLLPWLPTRAQSELPADGARREEPENARQAANGDRDEEVRQARRTVRQLKSELDAMHARMRDIEQSLRQAQDRLDSLQGRPARPGAKAPPEDNTPRPAAALPVAPAPRGETGRPGNVLPATPAPELPAPAAGRSPVPPGPNNTPRFAPPRADLPRGNGRPGAGGDYDRRLWELERKLDRLIEEMETLREHRSAAPAGRQPPKGS